MAKLVNTIKSFKLQLPSVGSSSNSISKNNKNDKFFEKVSFTRNTETSSSTTASSVNSVSTANKNMDVKAKKSSTATTTSNSNPFVQTFQIATTTAKTLNSGIKWLTKTRKERDFENTGTVMEKKPVNPPPVSSSSSVTIKADNKKEKVIEDALKTAINTESTATAVTSITVPIIANTEIIPPTIQETITIPFETPVAITSTEVNSKSSDNQNTDAADAGVDIGKSYSPFKKQVADANTE